METLTDPTVLSSWSLQMSKHAVFQLYALASNGQFRASGQTE